MSELTGIVAFTHTNYKGEVKDRRVIPHRVRRSTTYPIDTVPAWVLEGFCLDKKAQRTFHLEAVEDIRELLEGLEGLIPESQLEEYKQRS